jgi:ubiquinone/menaquinone biosynthesis C-methylase UbiE
VTEVKVSFDAADDYEQIMGRWSRAAAEPFLDWLAPPPQLRWLDIGCGTGAFTQVVLERCAPQSICGVDPAPAQILYAREHAPQAEFRVADAVALPFSAEEFEVAASALVINFIPDRAKAFDEMRRILRRDGVVAAYLWDRSPGVDRSPHSPMEQGLRSIGAEVLHPPVAPESTPEGAKTALESAGFNDIEVTAIEVTQTFRNFDEYWRIQSMPLAPVGRSIATLGGEQQTKLREKMHTILPASADGSITYPARVLAFKARK